MARAIKLARKGLYSTHPNPRVGCVLVKDGQIIGEGYHQKAGLSGEASGYGRVILDDLILSGNHRVSNGH
jgi:deoxycytidylate deaminase